MKKQTNLPTGGRKLSLNKKTISNLQPQEMNKKVGGQYTQVRCHPYNTYHCTQNQNTCPGHNTCQYTCI